MPSGLIAMAEGPLTVTVQMTLLVARSILLTLLEPVLVTKAWVPLGRTAMPLGLVPTLMVATTVGTAVVVSITETVPAPLLVT